MPAEWGWWCSKLEAAAEAEGSAGGCRADAGAPADTAAAPVADEEGRESTLGPEEGAAVLAWAKESMAVEK